VEEEDGGVNQKNLTTNFTNEHESSEEEVQRLASRARVLMRTTGLPRLCAPLGFSTSNYSQLFTRF
jgi:hypothetical protein